MRTLALSFAALLLALSVAGCGSGDDDSELASDPAPTTASPSPTGTTSAPTVGSYPAFEPTDYTFDLTVSCFCIGAGTPIEVTVVDAEVVDAVYGTGDGGRGGTKPGDPADSAFRLTINDIIDKANDTEADKVTVDWPAGQDHPTSVYVDGSKDMADDEVGYTIEDVQVS